MFLYNKEDHPNRYQLMRGKAAETFEKLNAGVYNLGFISQGPMSPPKPYLDATKQYEKGMNIEGGVFSQAWRCVKTFMKKEMFQAREAMDMLHKMGIIFAGKPGTGKTYLAGQIANYFAKEHNAISIMSTDHDGDMYRALIDIIREHDEDRLMVIVMDEFEKSRSITSSDMLSLLDGSNSRNNVLFIATVNDMSQLPNFLSDRPGRFEHTLRFRADDKIILKSMISQCIPKDFKDDFDVDELVKEFSNKANAARFGLKNNNDDFTIDRMRIVVRDLVAEKIEERSKPQKALAAKAAANVQ